MVGFFHYEIISTLKLCEAIAFRSKDGIGNG